MLRPYKDIIKYFLQMNNLIQKYKRRSIRLKDYDYSQPGGYFVTIVTLNRECLFGNIVDNKIILSPIGGIIESLWKSIPQHFPFVRLDSYQIMPNHIHGLINIVDRTVVGAQHAVPLQKTEKFSKPIKGSISTIIRSFKSAVTREINQLRNSSGRKL